MEPYNDGFVDVKRPGLDDHSENGLHYDRPRGGFGQSSAYHAPSTHLISFPMADGQAPSPTKSVPQTQMQPPPLSHASSSTSEMIKPENRRLSSGLGGGMGSLGSLKGEQKEEIVPVGFDEGVLRGLCDMDCALPLLADRIKQSIASCKQVAVFFRSRAEIEEKYARSLAELCRNTGDIYSRADCKAGTFVVAYQGSLKLQDALATNRIRFSQRLNEMSDELLGLAREGEKLRKMHKDNGARYQGILQESEMVMDKAKSRFDSTAEELERVLVAKEGESFKDAGMRSSNSGSSTSTSTSTPSSATTKRGIGKAMTKGGLLFKGKGPAQMQRQEDDIRARMQQASETFRKAVLESQALRQEYFNFQLPKILRLLKECADELDMGTQYHLTRFAFLYESTLVGDGTILNPFGAPEEGPGLKAIFEGIDNRTDFKSYMQNYAVARGTPRGPRREGPYEEGFLPPLPPHVQASANAMAAASAPQLTHPNGMNGLNGSGGPNGNNIPQSNIPINAAQDYAAPGIPSSSGATFGVDLGEQLLRDGTEVPKVVEKCAEAIEAYGLESTGIYRLSGTTSKVQALKGALDRDIDSVDVLSEDWSADINVVSGALKLWFRELPEPLLTYGLYNGFIEAARYENDRLRHIRLHEQVNELPDPNYATLKFFMGHLDRVRRKNEVNQMSVSNLSIVFGPTLLGAPPDEGGLNLEHMSFQCKAIETILERYHEIFVEEEEEGDHANGGGEPPI
ncbi:Rho GTPase-activating protein RGD1, partial [Tremellales sp. Uapishka_1]